MRVGVHEGLGLRVKELCLSYYVGETKFFLIRHTHYGD